MPKTVQIRDIDDELYEALKRRAGANGKTVPELLRHELPRIAQRLTTEEWLARIDSHGPLGTSTTQDVLDALDEMRGPWPDAGH